MSQEELTPHERKIWRSGYWEGKKDSHALAAYFIGALACLLILVVKLLIDR